MDDDEQMDDDDVKRTGDDHCYFISSLWIPISPHCSEDHSDVFDDYDDDNDDG